MIEVGLSSSSVFAESTAVAFELAASIGYDGVEIMVGTDSMSQDLADPAGTDRPLPNPWYWRSTRHVLLITQRVSRT
jgi:hypothetical protein